MGFSLTGSHIIFFVASVIVAGAVAGVFIAVTMGVTSSFSDEADRLQEQMEMDFTIINDPRTIPSADGSYIFYVKNIGGNRIITSNETFQLLLDGVVLPMENYTFSTQYIYPEECVSLYLSNQSLSDGYYTMRLIGPYACEDDFTFRIGG